MVLKTEQSDAELFALASANMTLSYEVVRGKTINSHGTSVRMTTTDSSQEEILLKTKGITK
jgi:hypothetical protein